MGENHSKPMIFIFVFIFGVPIIHMYFIIGVPIIHMYSPYTYAQANDTEAGGNVLAEPIPCGIDKGKRVTIWQSGKLT